MQDGGRTGRLYITFDGVKFDLTEDRYLALGADRGAIVAVPWGTLGGLPDGGPFTGLLTKPRLGPIVVGARRRLYSRRGLRVRGQVEGFVVGVIAALVVALITRVMPGRCTIRCTLAPQKCSISRGVQAPYGQTASPLSAQSRAYLDHRLDQGRVRT